ncbi:hypothetical protein LJR039_007559 [Pseudorhodoferax sp. LjRoot39]|uniref:esterase/lipase family protein n=1 Tax=Pseudorhodoferax sp. LjRoot39 TaxID=3342328 RepID=UPI003ECCEC99
MKLSRIKSAFRFMVVAWQVVFSGVATAEVVSHEVSFIGDGAPNKGNFSFDTTTKRFTKFELVWRGILFDVTSSANSPVTQNYAPYGPCPGFNPEAVYKAMTAGLQCAGQALSLEWLTFPPNPSGGTYSSALALAGWTQERSGFLFGVSYPNSSYTAELVSGTYKVSPGTSISIVDPVPLNGGDSLLDGSNEKSGITTAAERLATKGRIVKGISADGVAQIVIRIPAKSFSEKISISVKPDPLCGNGNSDNYGRVYDALSPPSNIFQNAFSGNVPLTIASTSKGPMAFAVYRAPADFVRSDCQFNNLSDIGAAKRTVALSLGNGTPDQQIDIVRPPALMVHGLWATSDDLGDLTQLESLSSMGLVVWRVNYGYNITISRGSPDNRLDIVSPGSALGFSYGANIVLNTSRSLLEAFRAGRVGQVPSAAARIDYIAHSMGNLVTRTTTLDLKYAEPRNFSKGYIHKLISIGGPHLGTPFANQALQPGNQCIRDFMAEHGQPVLDDCPGCAILRNANGAALGNGEGAAGSLKGNKAGSGEFGEGIKRLLSKQPNIPTTYIAGVMSSDQITRLIQPPPMKKVCSPLSGECHDVPTDRFNLVQILAVICPDDPMVRNFRSPAAFIDFLGVENDGVVPLNSQLNGGSRANQVVISGVLHSPGTAKLYTFRNFAPGTLGGEPTELTTPPSTSGVSLIVEKVQLLLNTPVTDKNVYR